MDMVKCIWIKFNRKEKLIIEISILHYSVYNILNIHPSYSENGSTYKKLFVSN